jgi:hypothetical protein
MRAHRVGIACALAALAAAPAAAQIPLTPRALGMGGGYVALARGNEALFQNPANLGLPGSPHWSFAIPTLAAGATFVGIDFGDVRDLIDFGDLEQDRKDEILAEIPDQGTEVRADVRLPLAAVQIRRLAFGVSYGIIGTHTIERDLVDLLLNGVSVLNTYDPNEIRNNTQGFRATYYDFAAAYGRSFGPLSVGATGHYYLGSDIVRSGVTSVELVGPPAPDVDVRYAGVRRKGGSGFGLDLGVALQPVPGLTLGASLGNVVNTFEWDGDLRIRRVEIDRDDYETSDLNAINSRYVQSETDFDASTASAAELALASDLDVDAELPRTLRLGAGWQPIPGTQVGASYQANLEDSRIAGLWEKQAGVGVQHRLAFFPLLSVRAGVASDLEEASQLSAGVSLGPVHFSVARMNDGEVDGADRAGWVAVFGLGTSSRSTMP